MFYPTNSEVDPPEVGIGYESSDTPDTGVPFGVTIASSQGTITIPGPDALPGSTSTVNQIVIQAVDEPGNAVTGDFYMNQDVQLITGNIQGVTLTPGGAADMNPISDWPAGGTVVDNVGGLTNIPTQGGATNGWMVQQQTWTITPNPGSGLGADDIPLQGTIIQVVVIQNGTLVTAVSLGGYVSIQATSIPIQYLPTVPVPGGK